MITSYSRCRSQMVNFSSSLRSSSRARSTWRRQQTFCVFCKQVCSPLLTDLSVPSLLNGQHVTDTVLISELVLDWKQWLLKSCFHSELPSLLPIVDVAEALLHVKNGAWFLCLLVANVPDSFNEGKLSFLVWHFSFLEFITPSAKINCSPKCSIKQY